MQATGAVPQRTALSLFHHPVVRDGAHALRERDRWQGQCALAQSTASSSRSSPQKTSPFTTKLGDPKTPSAIASSVARASAPAVLSDVAASRTLAGFWPISLWLALRFGSSPAGSSASNQRR